MQYYPFNNLLVLVFGSMQKLIINIPLTTQQALLGDGAEYFEKKMIEHTGIYGYEIMFAEYAFETIPGAKSCKAAQCAQGCARSRKEVKINAIRDQRLRKVILERRKVQT